MLLALRELEESSELDPQIAAFIAANPSPPIDYQDINSFRAAMQSQALLPPESGLEEYTIQAPVRDGSQIDLKVHKPSMLPAHGSALVVLSFGGGFIGGSVDQLTTNARALVRAFGSVVVNIGYRLAPEHKFPTAQTDCWDAVKWLAANATTLGADPRQGFIVGGVSAGANTSAVVSTLAVEEGLNPPITGQWLSVPSLMDASCVPGKYREYYISAEDNKDAPILTREALEAFGQYTEWKADSPLRFPVLSKVPMEKLPPTFFQADGMDILRDDTLIYHEMLKEAGVKTRINFYPGCPHAHFAFFPGLELTTTALTDVVMGMGWLLGKKISQEEAMKALDPVVLNV